MKQIARMAEKEIKLLNIDRNLAKGDWSGLSRKRLLWLAAKEFIELISAVYSLARAEKSHSRACSYWGDHWPYCDEVAAKVIAAREHVKHEAADLRNFVMMIVDNSGGLR